MPHELLKPPPKVCFTKENKRLVPEAFGPPQPVPIITKTEIEPEGDYSVMLQCIET
jgi:hypothetical protein